MSLGVKLPVLIVHHVLLVLLGHSPVRIEHVVLHLVGLLDDDELLGDLLRLGGLVLVDDDDAVVECRRRQLAASLRRAPRTCPLQSPRQSCA